MNDGNLPLSGVSITDRLAGVSVIGYTWPGADGELAPGQQATATAGYTITQDDIDAASVTNLAIANGSTDAGANVPSNDATTTEPISQAPALDLVKQADAS